MRLQQVLSIVVTMLAFIAGPALAEFTDAEKAPMLNLRDASNGITAAIGDSYNPLITSQYTTDANRSVIGGAQANMIAAQNNLLDALAWLFGVIPNVPGSSLWNQLAAMPRAERVASAFERLDGARNSLSSAERQWTSLSCPDSACQDAISRIIMRIGSAVRGLDGFDHSLSYLAPYSNDYPTVIGPHGRQAAIIWNLWRGAHYFSRAARDLAEAIQVGSPDGVYSNFGRPYTMLMMGAVRSTVDAMFIAGRVPWGEFTTMDPFFALMIVLDRLTNGQRNLSVSKSLHFVMFDWQPLLLRLGVNETFDVKIRDALTVVNDGWKHTDTAVWFMLVFPDCNRLRDPTRISECEQLGARVQGGTFDYTGGAAADALE